MDVSLFDYYLPKDLIAQHPAPEKDASKLLVYNRANKSICDDTFRNIGQYLRNNDVLVINDTKVRPARIIGRKSNGGGRVEAILLNQLENPLQWACLAKPGRRLPVGTQLSFGTLENAARIVGQTNFAGKIFEFTSQEIFDKVIKEVGMLPLPPYIKEPLKKEEDYQTVFAKNEGSVAAPTAGLHFTENLLQNLLQKDISFVPITLHIGLGTFKPVSVEKVEDHKMHHEYVIFPKEAVQKINEKKDKGGRIIAVGTTAARSLESTFKAGQGLVPWEGWTNLFIYPGYTFRAVDAILTNFHLPKSTLLMMICAFGGYNNIMALYKHAVEKKYRFFSLGDATLIL